jgi:hypothetical protein
MTSRKLLPAVSLLTLVLMTLHITDDIQRGISPPGPDNVGAVVIFLAWLVGVVVVHERRLGQVLMLLGGIFATAMPLMHMRGARYPVIAAGDGGFFFVWTLIVVGTTGALSAVLALHALWVGRRAG